MLMQQYTVAAGQTQILSMAERPVRALPMTIAAQPGGGGTVLVEYMAHEAMGVWQAWPAGTVAALTSDVLTSPVAQIRLSATTQPGNFFLTST